MYIVKVTYFVIKKYIYNIYYNNLKYYLNFAVTFNFL